MEAYGIWIAIAAALVGSYVGAVHYALHHFSRSRLEELLQERGHPERLAALTELNQWVLMTGVVRSVLNLAILVAMIGWFASPGDPAATWWDVLWAFLVSGVLIVVFSVAVAHSWGFHAAEPLLVYSLPGLHGLALVLKPAMALLHVIDPLVRRLLGVPKLAPDDASELEQEIMDVVSEGEKTGLVDEQQANMIEAVVEFADTTADEIMTPRTDVEGIEVHASLEQVKRIAREEGHSRFPVYEENLDNIVGVLYVKDLLHMVGKENGHEPFDLRAIVREALFVPESKKLSELLAELRAKKVHMALVLDEYGGTAGLITIEDILEEIVGEIQDEYEPEDETPPDITRLDGAVAEVDGRAYIDDVNDQLDIDLPEDEDYDTIGGFVFSTLGHIPEAGESFEFQQYRVTVLEAEKTKVTRVRIESIDGAGTPPAEAAESGR